MGICQTILDSDYFAQDKVSASTHTHTQIQESELKTASKNRVHVTRFYK